MDVKRDFAWQQITCHTDPGHLVDHVHVDSLGWIWTRHCPQYRVQPCILIPQWAALQASLRPLYQWFGFPEELIRLVAEYAHEYTTPLISPSAQAKMYYVRSLVPISSTS